MRISITRALAAAALSSLFMVGCQVTVESAPQASGGSVPGSWETDYEKGNDSGLVHTILNLSQNGNAVHGTYENGAVMDGTISGTHFSGHWQNGRNHGTVEFEFDSNFRNFQGWWAFDSDGKHHTWAGHH